MDPEYLNDEYLFSGIAHVEENERCAGNLKGVGLLPRDQQLLEEGDELKAHDPESGSHFELDDFAYRLVKL